jgi:hypothetical protein
MCTQNADVTILVNPQFSWHGKWVNMHRQGGKPGKAGIAYHATRLLVFACLCSLSVFPAGCSSTNKAKQDPLFGVNPPNPNSGAPASIPRTKNEVSAAPSSTGPTMAALAGGLPDSRPLAISPTQATADPTGWTGTAGLASTPKTAPGAALSAPVPVVHPLPRATDDPVVPASSWNNTQPAAPGVTASPQVPTVGGGIQVSQTPIAAPAGVTQLPAQAQSAPAQSAQAEDPLLAQLRARGVTWQKAQNVAGGVKFSCLVPNPQHPEVTRMYEAIGPDYPSAVRGALYLVDREQKQAGRQQAGP